MAEAFHDPDAALPGRFRGLVKNAREIASRFLKSDLVGRI